MRKYNLGDINNLITILGMNDKRLLREQCANELLNKTNVLYDIVKKNHINTKAVQQMKDDVSAYVENNHFSMHKIHQDYNVVLGDLFKKKLDHKSKLPNLTTNQFIKKLQKEV